MSDTPRDCVHGHLARSCEICDLERELAAANAELEKCRPVFARLREVEAERDAATLTALRSVREMAWLMERKNRFLSAHMIDAMIAKSAPAREE
jgi:hypothetical protein